MEHSQLSNRENLFGRLSVLNGFVTEEQLNEAKSGMCDGQFNSLAAALVAQDFISERESEAIDQLVDVHIEKHGGDPDESLASLSATVSLKAGDTDATQDFTGSISSRVFAPVGDFAGYEILSPIGKGGMGIVYKARQTKLDRVVALKMIKAGELADEEEIARFKAEAEAAAGLDHPGIVPVHEVGESNGQHYFSMGYVEGETLADLLRDGPLEPRYAADIVGQIADAVSYAHGKQIIHRDLKPGNVLMDSAGRPRIMDFGLAKRMAADSELTATGQIMGTPSYMPPEQAAGNETGPAADIYAVGAILYAITTGKPPHQSASPMDTLLAVLNDTPVAPRLIDKRIPKDLETICLKCLNKEPLKRYVSATDLAEDLECWRNSQPIKARRVGNLEKFWLWCKRRPVVASLLAALILLATIGSAVVWERSNAQFSRDRVDSLVKAEPSQVKGYIDEIEKFKWWTVAMLEKRHSTARDDSIEKTYLELALLRFDTSYLESLKDSLLDADVRNFEVVRNELALHKDELLEEFWTAFRDESDEKRRFRAGLALAKYAHNDEQWTADDAKFLVDTLLGQIPEDQPLYRRFLMDTKDRLYAELKRAFLDPEGKERQALGAAKAFAEYALDDIGRIADVAAEATVEQWQVLYSVLEDASPEPIHAALRPVVSEHPAEMLSPLDRVSFGKRRAGAAITLLRKGDREQIFDAFRVADDPESLTQFVHRCRARGVTPEELLECLDIADRQRQSQSSQKREMEDRVLFGILLALGEFPVKDVPDSKSLIERLADWHANDPSSAIHGATGWLLRHWGQEEVARQVDQTPVPYSADRQWYTLEIKGQAGGVLGLGSREVTTYTTFVVIPAGTYTIGSSANEPERYANENRHEVTITRPFAVLDREVTWAEAAMYDARLASTMRSVLEKKNSWSIGLNEPWVIMNWYNSVRFCRWLSTQAGLGEHEQAYANPATLDKTKFPADPNPDAGGFPKDWPVDLDRRGFRLLTEAEWEVACRAGAGMRWSFGSDVGLLDRYGWFLENSGKRAHEVRLKRPNLRGMFDMHGNAFEWCHDWDASYLEGSVLENPRGPGTGHYRVYRGGSWGNSARNCHSSKRFNFGPTLRFDSLGFRIATTLPSEVPGAK